jgi:hypothetical protein
MSNVFGTIRAFFLGLSALSRQFASSRLRQHRTQLVAGLLAFTYYLVQAYYFLHHSAVVPREKVSDGMGMMFQCVLAPVFYMGFQWLVSFVLREDVQAAWARFVAVLRRNALWAWWTGSAFARRAAAVGAALFGLSLLLFWAVLGAVQWVLAGFARRLARLVSYVRAFARTCVETGQTAR